MPFRSGFAAIIGRPNAGKSTLLNTLVGQKIAIVTHKAQTTRNRIQGFLNIKAKKGAHPPAQLVLIDTPGVHKPGSPMERRMMQEVYDALSERDLVLLIVDATEKFGPGDEFVLELVKKSEAPTLLLLNKIDRLQKDKLLPLIDSYRQLHEFEEIIPISAAKAKGMDELLEAIVRRLPEGPRYFPEDQVTDQPERFLAAEIIREKVLTHTGQEVPYSTAVIVERWEDTMTGASSSTRTPSGEGGIQPHTQGGKRKKQPLTRISAAIYCEREGQKAIIIGKRGAMLKKIGTSSRIELERLLGTKVFLEVFVKVRENWRESRHFLDELDWRKQLEALGDLQAFTEDEPQS
jgi:GTP-binding protein Era